MTTRSQQKLEALAQLIIRLSQEEARVKALETALAAEKEARAETI